MHPFIIDKTGKITINPQFDDINTGREYNEWVNSDYFDVSSITTKILEDCTPSTFKKMDIQTTFANRRFHATSSFIVGASHPTKLSC